MLEVTRGIVVDRIFSAPFSLSTSARVLHFRFQSTSTFVFRASSASSVRVFPLPPPPHKLPIFPPSEVPTEFRLTFRRDKELCVFNEAFSRNFSLSPIHAGPFTSPSERNICNHDNRWKSISRSCNTLKLLHEENRTRNYSNNRRSFVVTPTISKKDPFSFSSFHKHNLRFTLLKSPLCGKTISHEISCSPWRKERGTSESQKIRVKICDA